MSFSRVTLMKMPKELNLSAYDYRNRSRSPSSSVNDDSSDEEEEDDSSLRQSCGTANTYGNDTVMTGDHVEAILRASDTARERRMRQLVAGTIAPLVGGDDEEEEEESSSDSEGVVPKVCRRSHSRSNSVGSTELIAQVNEDDEAPPPVSAREQCYDYGTAMGGNEALHPISNLLRVRQHNHNSGNGNGNGGANDTKENAVNSNSSSSSSDDNKSSSSATNPTNNVYHIHDNISGLSSLASGGSMKSSSVVGESKSFIAAVLNYAHGSSSSNRQEENYEQVEGGKDYCNDEDDDDEERLVKSYSYQLESKSKQQGAMKKKNKKSTTQKKMVQQEEEEEEFENDEESQQLMNQEAMMHHQRLIDVPHYHNIRSSFTSLVGQIKDRATNNTAGSSGNNKKQKQQHHQQQEAAVSASSLSTPPPPPVKYSDHRQDQKEHHDSDSPHHRHHHHHHHHGGHTDDHQHEGGEEDDDDEEEEEQQYDLRPQTVKTTKRRLNRRPIQRRATTESETWNRRISTESESMWTVLSTSFTRRISNGSESSGRRHHHHLRRRDSTGSDSNGSTTVGTTNTTSYLGGVEMKKKQKSQQQTLSKHNDDDNNGVDEKDEEEDNYRGEREPYDDSDIRSVKSMASMDGSWIGMGNLGNIIGSNIVSGGSSDMNGGKRMRKRGMGDGKGDYHYGNGAFSSSSGGGRVRRINPFFVRRASMTPFIGEDGGDYFYDDDINGSKSYFYRPGITTLRRCGAIFILIAITALSSVLIGIYIPPSVGEGHNTIGTMQIEEDLFKIAESINQHCEISKMHSAKGRGQCERLCKNHLCCFDMIGDGYSCRDDDSKNCGVYSGCEVLVDSFEGQQEQLGQGNGQEQKGEQLDDALSLDGGFGDEFEDSEDDFLMYYDDDEKGDSDPFGSEAIFYNPGGQSTTTTTQGAQIGSLSVDNVCTESMVKTLDGRRHCETLCQDHHCCFDPVPRNSCRKDPDKMCPAFAKCEVLTLDIDTDFIDADNDGTTTHDEIKIGSQAIGAVCAETKVNTPSGKQECEDVCSSHLCCFSKTDFNCRNDPDKSCPAYAACEILNVMAAEEGKANGVVYWDDQAGGDNDSDPHNAVAAIQLNDEQKLQIKQEVNKNCKNKSSPDCFHACRDWFCCFESSDEKSCRSSTNNLCNLVQQCEVAAVNAGNRFPEDPEQLDDQEQDDVQAQPSSQQQIQPQPEDDYYQDDFLGNGVFNPFSPQMQEQDIDLSQQSSFRPQQQILQQQDDAQSSVQQQQDDDFNQEDDFLPEEQDEFQPPPQQQDIDLQQSSLRPQQQAPQQQGEAQYSVQPIQQQQADFRPQPAQQQQQEDAQQQYDFQPPEQQSGQNQPNMQPMPPQQNQNNYQQQDEFFQPQQQNDFQSQNNFQPPMQQQYDQNQSNMQPPPPPQQQNGSQSQQQYTQQQTQQPITPQQQNGQRLDQPNEQQQFEQPQQPMEENNFQPPIQPLSQQQQSNTNAVASKPPRPPPARCIPTGDDEIHTELYNDDWNDDSYDRCKRWETKYGMKISQYMDLYGVG